MRIRYACLLNVCGCIRSLWGEESSVLKHMLIWCCCGLMWDVALQSEKKSEHQRLEEALDLTMEQMAALQVCSDHKLEALKSFLQRINIIAC